MGYCNIVIVGNWKSIDITIMHPMLERGEWWRWEDEAKRGEEKGKERRGEGEGEEGRERGKGREGKERGRRGEGDGKEKGGRGSRGKG